MVLTFLGHEPFFVNPGSFPTTTHTPPHIQEKVGDPSRKAHPPVASRVPGTLTSISLDIPKANACIPALRTKL